MFLPSRIPQSRTGGLSNVVLLKITCQVTVLPSSHNLICFTFRIYSPSQPHLLWSLPNGDEGVTVSTPLLCFLFNNHFSFVATAIGWSWQLQPLEVQENTSTWSELGARSSIFLPLLSHLQQGRRCPYKAPGLCERRFCWSHQLWVDSSSPNCLHPQGFLIHIGEYQSKCNPFVCYFLQQRSFRGRYAILNTWFQSR